MANTLMFEVGVKMAKEQFEAIKSQIDKYNKEWQKDLQIKVGIENLEALTKALSQIGDTSALRNLRAEIAALNKEFLQLSKGAGGTGSIADRGLAQDIERQSQNIDRYTAKIKELTEQRSKLVGGTRNVNYGNVTSEIEKYTLMLEGANKKLQELQKQSSQPIVSANTNAANAFSAEGAAAQEAVQKLNALVAEKQQVVDAERKLAESSNQSAQALNNEKTGTDQTTEALGRKKKATQEVADASQQAAEQEGNAFRQMKLLFDIENKMAGVGNILSKSESFGLNPSLVNKAYKAFEELRNMFYDGKGFGDKNLIPLTNEQISAISQSFGAFESKYKNIIAAANEYNKTQQNASKTAENSFNAVATKIADVTIRLDKYKTALDNAANTPVNTSALDAQKQKVDELLRLLEQIKTNKGLTDDGRTMRQVMQEYGQYIKKADYAMANLNKQVREHQKSAGKDQAAEALKEQLRVVRMMRTLNKTANTAENLGLDASQVRQMIDLLQRYRNELQQIHDTGAGWQGRNLLQAQNAWGGTFMAADNANSALQAEITKKKLENAQSTSQLTAEEQKLAQAIGHSTKEMKNQSQILSDLKSMAMQYISVWGAQSFVNKIIETGGQLEQQRLSLSAILGDMEKANTLFTQVKELALKSPFGVVQIDQMTKQLAAYSFEYEELFDWTKRLADISAATGTSVDRLALALGHVRNEGALSGYTLRQFAMANVPVLKMLSENLGISSKEVRERVRKKEISADDVQEILQQLTNEGGMFYNAQEVMSQALNAKFKNLRDAFDIMYGEIAEGGVGDKLKELANILTQGAKEWQRYGNDILMVATAFGIGRVAMMLYNNALGQGTVSALKSVTASERQMQSYFRLANAAGLVTDAEYKKLLSDDKASVTALKLAVSNKKLTISELQRAVALGKVRKEVALAAVANTEYEASIKSVTVLSKWQRGIFLLGEGFRAAGVAIKGFFAAAWPLLALTAVFDLFNRTSQNNEATKSAAEGAAKATNKYQDLQAMTERLGSSQGKTNDQLENNIKAMKEALIAVGEYTDELKKQVDSVDSLAEKYQILQAAMKGVSDKASDKQARKQARIEEGLATGSGSAWAPWNWFRDNALRDAKDIDDYTQDLYLAFDKNDKALREGFEKILKTEKKWKKEFASMSAKDIFMGLDSSTQDSVLYKMRWGGLSDEIKKAGSAVANVLYGGKSKEAQDASGYSYRGALEELRGHKEELAKAFEDAFRVDYPEIDLSKADDDQKIIFAKWLDTTIDNLENVKEAGKKALNDVVIEGTIKVRPKYSLDNENWSKFLEDFKSNNPIAYEEWNRHTNWGAMTEEEKRKTADSYKKTFSGSTVTTIGNDTKKRKKELEKEEKTLNAYKESIIYQSSKSEQERVTKRLEEIKEEKKRLSQAQKDYNQYGDPDKNKGGSQEDKNAKVLREKVRILKEAADSYQYWREKVGDAAAESRMQGEFGQLLKEQNLEIKNADELRAKLQKLREEYSKKPQTKAMVEAIKEIDKELAQLDRKDFEKTTEEFASKVQIELDSLTRAWEIFNNVREATGNVELAVQLSGIDYANGNNRNMADALKKKLEQEFIMFGGGIKFDMGLSNDEIEKQIQAAMPEASQAAIKGLVEEYKKWRDLQKDVYKNDIILFSKIIGSASDYQTEIEKIDEEYENAKESLDRLLDSWNKNEKDEDGNRKGISPEQYQKALKMQKTSTDYKKWQKETAYINLMNHSLAMTKTEIAEAARIQEEHLNKNLEEGVMTAEQYVAEMSKLKEIMSNYETGSTSSVSAFMKGGMKGLSSFYKSRMEYHLFRYANATDKNSAQAQADKQQAEQYRKKYWKTEKSAEGAEQFIASIGKMKEAVDFLSDAFSKLGKTTTSETLQDAGTVLGGMANGASTFGQYGAFGAFIGAGIGMFTGTFEAMDNFLARAIQELQENTKALENSTEVLETSRDRTLGYDNSGLMNYYYQRYKQMIDRGDYDHYVDLSDIGLHSFSGDDGYTITSKGAEAMRDFYEQLSKSSSFETDLNNLKQERENYISMYHAEAQRKNASDEALEEYKKKIADLDDQIRFFAEDLSKSLYGIDLKGWADQFGDALMTAFENGEDAAKAFEDTTKDVMSSALRKMLSLGVIQPMLERLRKKLFGENGEGGSFDPTNPEGTIDAAMRDVAEFFGTNGDGQKMIEATKVFYDKWNEFMNSQGLSLESSSSSTGSSIKSITEQTADLLASYINAIRADVSVDREMIAQYYPMFYQAMTQGNATLRNLEEQARITAQNTASINYNTGELVSLINGLRNKNWRIPVA